MTSTNVNKLPLIGLTPNVTVTDDDRIQRFIPDRDSLRLWINYKDGNTSSFPIFGWGITKTGRVVAMVYVTEGELISAQTLIEGLRKSCDIVFAEISKS